MKAIVCTGYGPPDVLQLNTYAWNGKHPYVRPVVIDPRFAYIKESLGCRIKGEPITRLGFTA
jgi:hypothetical protein